MHSKYLNLHLPSRMFLRTQGWKTIMISSTNRTNSARCAHANVIIFRAQMHLNALAVYSLPLYRRAIACRAMLWRPYYARFSCIFALNTDQMRCRIVRRTSVQLMQLANESKVRDELQTANNVCCELWYEKLKYLQFDEFMMRRHEEGCVWGRFHLKYRLCTESLLRDFKIGNIKE